MPMAPLRVSKALRSIWGYYLRWLLRHIKRFKRTFKGVEKSARPRRVEALRLIGYNLEKLASHLKTSRRILNDLRMLRRILQQRESAD